MKIKFILLFSIFSFVVYGQENVLICFENQSNVENLIADRKFNDAEKIGNLVLKNCASINEKFFLNVEKIYNHNLEFAKNTAEKNDVIKNLIKIYDLYDKNFPENKNGNDIKKTILLYDNNIGTKQEILTILNKNFSTKKSGFINPRIFYIYFELYVNESKQNNSKIKIEDLISKFITIDARNSKIQIAINSNISDLNEKKKSESFSAIDQTNLKNNIDDLLSFKTVQNATKGLLEPYLTCQNLDIYCASLFEVNKNDDSWLKFISQEFFAKNCLSSIMFEKIAIQSNLINSTPKSNFYLGYLYSQKNKISESEKYFNNAADLETNLNEKAIIYYTIGTTIYGINNRAKAKEYLDKSIAINPNFAKSYLFLAELYESSIEECTKTPFEKKAIFWLIASTIEKAGIAETYLKESTKKQANAYLQKAPTKAEILKSGLAGKTITFDCFINQTIDIPSK